MAAGEGSRMKPLTDTIPKPLLKICGKTILEHNIEPIIEFFDEIYMVVKYKQEKFFEHFGKEYKGKPIRYIEQIDAKWTWAAILSLERHIDGAFVVVSADDLYDAKDILKLSWVQGHGTLCKRVDHPENFGIFTLDQDGKVSGIVEKPKDPTLGNLANIGVHKFDSSIFPMLRNIPLSHRGELEITDLIHIYIEHGGYEVVEASGRWITIGYPWDLLKADDEIIGKYEKTIDMWATIEPNVTIKGNLLLGPNVTIKSGTYIEGNCYIGHSTVIGPNAYIRGTTSIGANSKVWAFVELKNSYIGENTHIPHLSYIGDSVLGNDVNIWAGSKVANLRHDHKNIHVKVKESLVDTGREKFGVVIGDHARLGINTLIYPGRTIPSHHGTLPGEVIK